MSLFSYASWVHTLVLPLVLCIFLSTGVAFPRILDTHHTDSGNKLVNACEDISFPRVLDAPRALPRLCLVHLM
jgi:hypothetical protein